MAIKQWLASKTGEQAEQQAKEYLLQAGLTFIEQNYKVKSGEIDLIFKHEQLWVFVEVKYRQDSDFGFAAEYFTPSKRAKMLRAIACFFTDLGKNIHHEPLRLDLVAIDDDQLQWFKNV